MARFWDTSAIVPLLAEQEHSQGARFLSRSESEVVVWQFTATEAVAALTKLVRTDVLSEVGLKEGLARLDALAARWTVVQALGEEKIEQVRARARALMLRHPLKSGDALQLAAALDFFERPRRRGFVAVDGTLARAAEMEGFVIFRPEAPKRGGRGRI